jgi:hypothetical protein
LGENASLLGKPSGRLESLLRMNRIIVSLLDGFIGIIGIPTG